MSTIKKTYCPLCLSMCGVRIEAEHNRVISISNDFDDPVSGGYVCELANKLPDIYNRSNIKINTPLKKINGQFYPISWSTAISEISQKLSYTLKNFSPDSILYFYDDLSNFVTSEYSFAYFWEMGIRYYYNILSWETVPPVLSSSMIFSDQADSDYESSQTLMIIGKNAWITNHAGPKIRKVIAEARNSSSKTLIVVDPVRTKTAEMADIHVQLKPGTDAWFLLALILYMSQNNLLDAESVKASHCEELLQKIDNFKLTDLLNVCGITIDTVKLISEKISSGSFSIMPDLGLNHSINQLNTFYYVLMLQVLTGNMNKPGGLFKSRKFFTEDYSAHRALSVRTPITDDVMLFGTIPSQHLAENLKYFKAGIFSLYLFDVCSNAPDKAKIKQEMEKIPFKVGFSIVLNDTAKLMDYILPIHEPILTTPVIKPTVWNNVIKLSTPIFETVDSESGPKHIEEILEMLESNLSIIPDYTQILGIFTKLFRSDLTLFVSELKKQPRVVQLKISKDVVGKEFNWPWLGVFWWKMLRWVKFDSSKATHILDSLRTLETTGYCKLDWADSSPLVADFRNAPKDLLDLDSSRLENKEYKFILSAGFKRKMTFNNTLTDNKHWVEVSVPDAEQLKLTTGDLVRVVTSVGELITECVVADWLQPNNIRIPYFKDINLLTSTANGKTEFNPTYKIQFANIEKI